MANRLAQETSPYLLQHRDNPVDWFPWGPEALARARELDRPILLSVGYSACHWCHVMERESFEDEQTAAYMNAHFINVKVDREERPDVDALYMEAVQAMSGRGGWPMTVFCDPEGIPFYGGTYFPPEESRGMPSFRMVMEAVAEAFANRREELQSRAPETRARLGAIARVEPADEELDGGLLEASVERLREAADMERGGFGSAPKFPPASALELLLAVDSNQVFHGMHGKRDAIARDGGAGAEREEVGAGAERGEAGSAGTEREEVGAGDELGGDGFAVVECTLDGMLAGGIYDQLGGGFSRYSVDAAWLVPHFEKMLYDNAQLALVYLHGWQALGRERYRRVCEETLDWALREIRGPEGAFYSALDADSEGEEGRFYVWTPEEIRQVLGGAAEEAIEFYGVTEAGNFEGRNVLHLAGGAAAPEPDGLAEARQALDAARAARVPLGLDDKRIASWNALMVAALAEAGAALGREDYLAAARGCADFVLTAMRDPEGRLLRSYKDGESRLNAYLEDHAFLLEALLALYEATFETRWFSEAEALAETTIARFGDPGRGGFFSTSDDHEELIARRKEVGDHPIPSGNSAAALGLLRLAALTGERRYEEQAVGVLRLFCRAAPRQPDAFAHLLRALDFHLSRTHEVALVGEDLTALARVVRSRYEPHIVVAGGPEGSEAPPLLRGRTAVDGRPTAYVCEDFSCRMPVSDPQALSGLL